MKTSAAQSQRNVRPHPDPLPRGREQPLRVSGFANDGSANPVAGILVRRQAFLPLPAARQSAPAWRRLGERAGVRASIKPFPSLLLTLVICVTGSFFTHAQNFSIDWHTIDGGGGTSTGGVYSVSGSIGQPDAGTMSGGSYSLAGGFWGIISAIQTPDAPLLILRLTPTNTVEISWPLDSTGFSLQQNSDLNTATWVAPAETVTDNGTNKFIIVNPPLGNRYYRLNKP